MRKECVESMIPPELANFFLASTGAGAALVGLLFIAISIAPDETVKVGAPIERQAVAASAFTALLNPFFLSLYALLPHTNFGWVALIVSLIGLSSSLFMAWKLFQHPSGWLSAVRRAALALAGLALYGSELYNAVLLLQSPSTPAPVYTLAGLLGGVYALGLIRAWELLGGRRYQPSFWLGPLRDVENQQTQTNTETSHEESKTRTD
jgi:hypothetical protein